MKRNRQAPGQIVLFPPRGDAPEAAASTVLEDNAPTSILANGRLANPLDIVVCGSFHKDLAALSDEFEELRDLGFRILSPTNMKVVSETDGFVFMEGEETSSPEAIEMRHLDAIKRSSFVWLHTPEGYLGPSAALEVGFARACGIPVYARTNINEKALQPLVTTVSSPLDLFESYRKHPVPPVPAVQSFQTYYAHAAVSRGYQKESAQNTLLLMLEEFGELARAIRKHEQLRRDSSGEIANEEQELADIFIYVVHMANVLGIDLGAAVDNKERMNIKRFLAR